MIIAAHAGTGKTTLGKLYPESVLDFVCGSYKYVSDGNFNPEESESIKADPWSVIHEDWPYNYVEAIQRAMGGNKIILIPPARNVLTLLKEKEIPYILCYPQRDAKEVYRKRYMERGNTEYFLDIFIDGWDVFMDGFKEDTYGTHIVLKPDEFLSDVIDKEFIREIRRLQIDENG